MRQLEGAQERQESLQCIADVYLNIEMYTEKKQGSLQNIVECVFQGWTTTLMLTLSLKYASVLFLC